MIVLVIHKADRIENQVIMNMIFVYMGGKHKLILAAQDFFCKLHADLMGLFRPFFSDKYHLFVLHPFHS